ncbi:hypothetical protein CN305_11100 [Bacillus cereus]|uniref:Uncharacterized protein n=1 Tax=Bacillus thuringiensis serovar mexicanensis TaxID=180868 RepID=A0A242W6Y3_BACTU|nr:MULTISPECIES: hypothetical protein [Bacillus cereus group]EEM57724.1 hypothetical protein bthur0007_45250 [Bacillus thuringiensis serovar monterrey BGSC 4AJ1]MEB9668980.1 hypothetical protein [Bacillus anthracis]OTW47926.1 hypothetical protein BK699_12115 [Bacillus thuringiensis serovar mexicanensis]OTW97981.1 hypothetical protein BK705_29625 [Bacillus thuringiensis serovar monterrey]PEW56429.1 hypothetical protein CN443_21095 [Bacillus cereus]
MDQLTVNEQPIVSSVGNTKLYSKDSFKGNSCAKSNLREIVYELDEEIGSIGAKVSTLEDVEILMARLMEDMDRVVSEGNENFYFHEFHRKLRVYWQLINYTTSGLNKDFEKTSELKEELFNKVVKNCEKGQ